MVSKIVLVEFKRYGRLLSGPRVCTRSAQQRSHIRRHRERPAVHSRERSKRFPSATLGAQGMSGGCAAPLCRVDGSSPDSIRDGP